MLDNESLCRNQLWQLEREQLADLQWKKLQKLLQTISGQNRFYEAKYGKFAQSLGSWSDFQQLPTTRKEELIPTSDHQSSFPSLAANHTWPEEKYTRFHRTSGTHGQPMVVLDSPEDWAWWIETWQHVLDAAQVVPSDRVLLAFSFGPFIGFWSAFEACLRRGSLVLPGGGLSSLARLDLLMSSHATVLFTTPSYAIHLAEVAHSQGIDLHQGKVRTIIVAGEPGGSIPEIRTRIESLWGARLFDHAGATEIGPWGFGSSDNQALHVIESEFIAEFLPVEQNDKTLFELVLTNLGRSGCPVIRYRTGDLVRPSWPDKSVDPNEEHSAAPSDPNNCRFVRLEGGVLGRVDDMVIIRGVNIFPSSIEAILRSFPEVTEYRMILERKQSMDQLRIEVEDLSNQPQRIAKELEIRLSLRVDVKCVPSGSLPRFEGKGKRWIDQRQRAE